MACWRFVLLLTLGSATWACGSPPAAKPEARPALTTAPQPVPAPSPATPLCEPPTSLGPDDPAGKWTRGADSRVCTTLIGHATHDGSYGRTRVVFESDAQPDAPIAHELEGRYHVLAYSDAAHAFVLGGLFETGVFMFMDVLRQVDARTGALHASRYELPLHIVSAVASDDGDNIALLAAPGWSASAPRLWMYRSSLDALYGPLGPAPAPPPSDFECDRASPRRWLDVIGQDGYAELDPGIITFPSPTQVRVSYGADTCRARAQRRRSREWDLTQLKVAKVAQTPPASKR